MARADTYVLLSLFWPLKIRRRHGMSLSLPLSQKWAWRTWCLFSLVSVTNICIIVSFWASGCLSNFCISRLCTQNSSRTISCYSLFWPQKPYSRCWCVSLSLCSKSVTGHGCLFCLRLVMIYIITLRCKRPAPSLLVNICISQPSPQNWTGIIWCPSVFLLASKILRKEVHGSLFLCLSKLHRRNKCLFCL